MTNDKPLTITPAERDIILAALRLYQHAHDRTERGVPDAILDIAANSDAHEELDSVAIEDLRERVNA